MSTTLDLRDSAMVESLTDEILNFKGETSTMEAEMAAIDQGIAELKLNDLSYIPGTTVTPPSPVFTGRDST